MGETRIQEAVLSYLNSLPHCMAENVSGNAHQSGRADINACYKGHCLKIELKDPEDDSYTATQQQLLYLKRWRLAGAVTGVCYSVNDVKKLLEKVDEIQRGNDRQRKD